ncbi:MAG: dihydrodipicolinate synthase family protein [Bryobacteraceae bacterium]
MNPFSSSQIRGTWATLLLPIREDDSIDWARLADEIDVLTASGAQGIYSNGTACEFYAQSEKEFDRVGSLLAEKCERASVPFQIGASHMSPQLSLERVRRAAQWKPAAIQVVLPDWYPVTNAEACDFLAKVAEVCAPIGLVLYNPPHAKRVLQPEDFGVLAQSVPSLLGVKVARSDAEWCGEFKRHAGRLSLFVPGNNLATGHGNGAHGSYSNVAALEPAGAARWNQLMELDIDAALGIERRIVQFMKGYILPFRERAGISNQGLDKLLAAVGGWADVGTRLRWPYRWVPTEDALALRPVARRLIPELFEH